MHDPLNHDYVMPDDNIYGKALTDLEDHIEININSDGDQHFLKLLKTTRTYADIAYDKVLRTGDQRYKSLSQNPGVARLYPVCVARAKAISLSGEFSEGDCSQEKFHEAANADLGLQRGNPLPDSAKQVIDTNSAAAGTSPGAAELPAAVGHVISGQEQDELPLSSAAAKSPAWRYVKDDDKLHAKVLDKFILDGTYLTPPHTTTQDKPSFVVVCEDGDVKQNYFSVGAVLIGHDTGLGRSPEGLEARIDGKKKSLYADAISSDLEAFFFSRSDLNDVLKGHQVIVGVNEYLAAQVIMQFDMPDPVPVLSGGAKDKMLHPKKWYQ